EMPRNNHMLEEFYGVYCTACYKVGMYDKALVAAKEYQKYRSNILQNNFEMMTQTEREGFLNNGGAGSGGLELLLPNFPNELSGDVYNSMLQEKGLLLRASDRFRRSVMNSGNADLINSLNTLDGLKAELAKMEQVPNMQQGDFNISPEYWAMQEQIEVLEKTIKRDGEEYFAQTDTVPEWQDIQQHLNYDEVAIEFVMSDSLTGALVLKPDMKAPLYVPLTNSYELNAEMSDLSKLPIEEHAARLYQSDELGLYAKLWKPLESVLSGVSRVYFSPTGYLNTLAFAAIRCPGGEYLADRYDMHQLTTTAEIVKFHNSNSTNENKTALLVGDVYYSPEHEDMANEFRQLNAYSDNRAAVEDEFGYLSFTGKEIADISAVMQKSEYSCITRSGNDATEENLNLIDGDSPEILHLSTHGFFVASDEDVTTNKFLEKYPGMRFSSMYRSGLAFVGANEAWEGLSASVEDNKDGIVTSNEVSVLDLRNTRLAVLSACQTAVGYYSKEGVFGMNRGFKQAGVQSIIATLWNVNDESTSMFMSKFYSKWLSGIPMQQSFKEAMVELRELYPSPYYWAPFILVDAK
ncbi:MAG: CHAT domain-containing protein, partial [Muribaculaceae bacterium]|nr:CHAT domain-containing protein [Muribaculaceae bacterium]